MVGFHMFFMTSFACTFISLATISFLEVTVRKAVAVLAVGLHGETGCLHILCVCNWSEMSGIHAMSNPA